MLLATFLRETDSEWVVYISRNGPVVVPFLSFVAEAPLIFFFLFQFHSVLSSAGFD